MRIDRSLVEDTLLYDIMYFSPMQVGVERYSNQLYFSTDMYARKMPTLMIDRMHDQIKELRHVELGMLPFDKGFRTKHREHVLFHCKMALAYLDAREARISMKLCELGEPASLSSERHMSENPEIDLDFLRIIMFSVMACAARRVKLFQKAIDVLTEAKSLCMRDEGEESATHPLLTAMTLLNLSAILGDADHDEHGLRWGLQALSILYGFFSSTEVPDVIQTYFMSLACHNAALLSVKLGKWADASELVDEGLHFAKRLDPDEDGLREKLIAVGAQAKKVPEGFLTEAVNVINGWGEDPGNWNLSFWDFTAHEVREETYALRHTKTLKHLIIEHHGDVRRFDSPHNDAGLAGLILAAIRCFSLELLTISSIDFDPRKVWRRIKKTSFLETSWFKSAMNFSNILDAARKPEVAQYSQLFRDLNNFEKKMGIFVAVLGNECDGVDLSENAIGVPHTPALVHALRRRDRPRFTRQVASLILRSNRLDAQTARDLARIWDPAVHDGEGADAEWDSVAPSAAPSEPASPKSDFGTTMLSQSSGAMKEPDEPGVTSLDISHNAGIGDGGFETLVAGIAQFKSFRVLRADTIGLGQQGCLAVQRLDCTKLDELNISNNAIGSTGAETICRAAASFVHLHTLKMDSCGIDADAAPALGQMLRDHGSLRKIDVSHNRLESRGAVEFCGGAAEAPRLQCVHMAHNLIYTQEASAAIGSMMRGCETLVEVSISGNEIDPRGARLIGGAIEHSRILTMFLEEMGLTEEHFDEFLDHGAAETQDLQVMILNKNPVGDEGLAMIAECLSIGLTNLALSSCSLTAEAQATLLNLVSLSPNLQILDLSHNELGPTACSDMVRWMTQNDKETYSLRSLELAHCHLGDQGLLQLVPVMSALNYIGVKGNGITSQGLAAVMKSNSMIQLKALDLSHNKIGEEGVHALTHRFHQEQKRSLWNPKQLASTIDTICMSSNDISPSLAASTDAFLKVHTPLLTVIW